MIPKIIHYCWFGGKPLPPLAQKCLASWKQYCPDYEIREWNEQNFDVKYNDYTREACQTQKWALLSDVTRLYALVKYGGVYMDTDMELFKPLDEFLPLRAFTGCESFHLIGSAILACEPSFPLFQTMLDEYAGRRLIQADGSLDFTPNVRPITALVRQRGFVPSKAVQTVEGLTIYPTKWFYPFNSWTGLTKKTRNTHSHHAFDASWWDEDRLALRVFRYRLCKIFGGRLGIFLYKCWGSVRNLKGILRADGFGAVCSHVLRKIARR